MDFSQQANVLVSCPLGAAPFLAEELRSLGFPILRTLPAAVETHSDLRGCMRLNLFLRTANRVMWQILQCRAHTPEQLYTKLKTFPWENLIKSNGYVSVASSVENEYIRDSRFANMKVKDALVDRIRAKTGQRPDAGPEQKGTVLFLYWRGDECTLYLDTSGEPLSRRGYRLNPWKAPMQESLAAATILASPWGGFSSVEDASQNMCYDGHFLNPMCGSGTLAIEAALMSMNSAPGIMRDNFCFMHDPDYNAAWWDELLDEAEDAESPTPDIRIIASDHDAKAVEVARSNAKNAGVDSLIEFSVCDFRQTPVPHAHGTQDTIFMNPEYGKRLGDERELVSCYEEIGNFFKQSCNGYTGYIFTGNSNLAKRVGLRTKRRIPFHTADLECRLLEYELYSGSRKS
ncbi:MAG: class I SAM-dependent RNA methyltransferase [Pseudomonadota bacterium]